MKATFTRYPMDEVTSPTETYSVRCTGDVVVGDRVRFDEAVFSGSYRRPKFQGVRTIEAKIVADSYGAQKQQHTFTMIVLTCSGLSPLEEGEQIQRKARNVYRRETWRAPWTDESARITAADEKHARGDAARAQRDRRRAEEEWWDRF